LKNDGRSGAQCAHATNKIKQHFACSVDVLLVLPLTASAEQPVGNCWFTLLSITAAVKAIENAFGPRYLRNSNATRSLLIADLCGYALVSHCT